MLKPGFCWLNSKFMRDGNVEAKDMAEDKEEEGDGEGGRGYSDGCFKCGAFSHWARDGPQQKTGKVSDPVNSLIHENTSALTDAKTFSNQQQQQKKRVLMLCYNLMHTK